jgi:cellulose synthase (UDP-forming)
LQGGLIAIGTWWVHALGFIYTLLRRKVPYNPTPKDGKEENTLGINIPNLAMAALSILAIIYGLYRDLNPYSLIMAGFASLNVLFITFIFFASMQNTWRNYKAKHAQTERLFIRIWRLKDWFWRFRHGSYRYLRLIALPLALALGLFLVYSTLQRDIQFVVAEKSIPKRSQFFIAETEASSLKTDVSFALFDLDASADKVANFLAARQSANQYAYIHWAVLKDSISPFTFQTKLLRGDYDPYLHQWFLAFQQNRAPLFLAPFPQFAEKANQKQVDSLEVGKSWAYIYDFFLSRGINNLMLVYSSPDPMYLNKSFPGLDFVSFIEINGKDLLYQPFPKEALEAYMVKTSFQYDIPWLLNLTASQSQNPTLSLAALQSAFPHFNGIIHSDNNQLSPQHQSWLKAGPATEIPKPKKLPKFETLPSVKNIRWVQNGLGTNYYKGLDWRSTQNPLFRRVIADDFKEMKSLGIDHINRYGPSIYDKNIFKEAQLEDISISYSFFIGDPKSFAKEKLEAKDLDLQILKTVDQFKDEMSIRNWHLGGAVWNDLGLYFYPPELFYQKEGLITRLDSLTKQIKKTDPSRLISIELDYSFQLKAEAKALFNALSAVDLIGINISSEDLNTQKVLELIKYFEGRLYIHSIGPKLGLELHQAGIPVNFNSWQDDVLGTYVNLNGLKNIEGEKKAGYKLLEENKAQSKFDGFKIIPTARLTAEGALHYYSIVVKEKEGWRPLAKEECKLSWFLAKTDGYESIIALEKLDYNGAALQLSIPANAHLYNLVAYLYIDDYVLQTKSSLSTPLYFGPNLIEPSREEIEFQKKKSR